MGKGARENKAQLPPQFFYRLISVQLAPVYPWLYETPWKKKKHEKIRLIKNPRSLIWPRLTLTRLYLFYESPKKKHAKKSASLGYKSGGDYKALFHINCVCISFLASILWRLLVIYRCPDLCTLHLNFWVAENITKEVSQCGFKRT